MSIKKSIGWTDMTLNPIKGKCQGGCWYCWTKPLYKRKFLQPELNLNLDVFFKLPKSPKRIFLCSTHDLFGGWIPSWWRTAIFERIESNPQHTFQILTKFPQNIDREMPSNAWLGVSVTSRKDLWRIKELHSSSCGIKFVSAEPLLSNIIEEACLQYGIFDNINWIIAGRLTGYGEKYNPDSNSIMNIVELCMALKIPVFLKNNLNPIWGENLIQEFPE